MGTATKVVDKEYLKSQFKNFNDILVKPKIADLQANKVDKVAGKGLSSNDFTDALKTKLEGLSNYDDTELINAINTLNGDINTEGSVAKITADAVAAIVASAPQDFDTLKEISDWIADHADSAAAMNSQITANKNAIDLLNGDENTTGSVAHSIKEAVDALAYEIEDTDIDFANLDKIIISGDNEIPANNIARLQLTSSVSGVTWSSSDDTIATVDQSGNVTGVTEGTVTITASKSGYTSGTIAITVIEGSICIDMSEYSPTAKTFKLTSNISGVTWSSSDDTIATIDQSGRVTVSGEGEVTFTASKEGYAPVTQTLMFEASED